MRPTMRGFAESSRERILTTCSADVKSGRDATSCSAGRWRKIGAVSKVIDAPSSPSAAHAASTLVRAWVGGGEGIQSLIERVGGVDQVGVDERVDSLKRRSIKRES